jgi:hypothetical protein
LGSIYGILLSIEHAENDHRAVFFDSKVNGIREGIDGLDPDVVVTDGSSSGQAADLFKVGIQSIGKLKAQTVTTKKSGR